MLLLPATTRYEIPGGVTETTTERRIVYSPPIDYGGAEARRLGECRPEWEVLCEIVSRVRPEPRGALGFADTAAIRAEIARAEPRYAGIERLKQKGDQVQWGGPRLFEDGRFATPSGRAGFHAVEPPAERGLEDGELFLSTRRGRQFNSMVHHGRDALTGLERSDLLMNAEDGRIREIADGDRVVVSSPVSQIELVARFQPIKAGNVEAHWPECIELLPWSLDPDSGEPEYGVRVRIERAGAAHGG